MAYITQFYTWSTGNTITAARLNGNVSNLIDGLNGGTKDINIAKLQISGSDVIDGSENITNIGNITGTSAGNGTPVWTLKNTNADASSSEMQFYKLSASPADNDDVGKITFYGDDDGATKTLFAQILAESTDVTDTTEDGKLTIYTMKAGTSTASITIESTNVTLGGTLTDGTALLSSGAWTGVTSLTVDNMVLNGNDISTSSGNLTLTPVAGSKVLIDTNVTVDGGVVTIGTSLDIASSVVITGTLDEDDMSSDSDVKLATQQSIKAYVDAQVGTVDTWQEVMDNGNTFYTAVNDGNPQARIGASDAEELHIQTVYDSGAQTLDYVLLQTDAASATANKGLYRFNVDGTDICDIDDGGIDLDSGKALSIAGTDVLTSSVLGTGVLTSSLTSVGTLTSLTSGLVTINVTGGGVITAKGGTTGSKAIRIGTASNSDFYLGTEDSAGSFYGGTAYAAILYNAVSTPMEFFTNATKRMSISASGLIQFSAATQSDISGGNVLNAKAGTTSEKYIRLGTVSNSDLYVGTEDSASAVFGATAYAAVMYNSVSTPIEFFTNATKRFSIGSSGTVEAQAGYTSNQTGGAALIAKGGTTTEKFIRVGTASNSDLYVGTEDSSGSVFGGTAYAGVMYNSKATPLEFFANGDLKMTVTSNGSIYLGDGQIADAATDGFVYIPTTTSGAPSGVPTSKSGMVPMVYDDTNNKLYVYNTAWKSVTLA